ncbi:MAG: transposase [Janthinobacterium lividum]
MHVFDVQAHQLRAAEGSGKADQKQRPVPHAEKSFIKGVHHAADLGSDSWCFALLPRAFGAADAGPDEADSRGGGRGFMTGGLVNLGDGGKAPSEGAGFEGVGESGQVEGGGLKPSGKRGKSVRLAPAGAAIPVRGVSASGVFGFGLAGVVLLGHHNQLREAMQQMPAPSMNTASGDTAGTQTPPETSTKAGEAGKLVVKQPASAAEQARKKESAQRRERRLANYAQVHELHRQGLTIEAIARQVGIGGRTVQRYLAAQTFPERSRRRRSARSIDAFSVYLKQRFAAGCHNAAQLFRELQAQGFGGSYASVWESVHDLRAPTSSGRGRASPLVPSVYSVACWMQGHLSAKPSAQEYQRAFVERLCQLSPPLREAQTLVQQFIRMVRDRQAAELSAWLEQSQHSQCSELRLFGLGLRQDLAAVTAALSSEWSNGQTEGQVNRLKTIKRQMYGRASFGLLRARVLASY